VFITEKIAALGDWKGETLARLRARIREADPDVVEEWKWMGTPVWSHDGGICTGETYKATAKRSTRTPSGRSSARPSVSMPRAGRRPRSGGESPKLGEAARRAAGDERRGTRVRSCPAAGDFPYSPGRSARMTRRSLFLLAAVVLSWAFTRAGLAADPSGVRFRTIDEGFAEARASGKPLLLYFTADWCPPCHSLELEVFHSSRFVRGIESDFVPVKVVDRTREDGHNAPDVDALVRSARVTGFPTLVVVRADGIAAVRNVGYSSRGATLSFLREAVSRLEAAEEKKRRARARSSPGYRP